MEIQKDVKEQVINSLECELQKCEDSFTLVILKDSGQLLPLTVEMLENKEVVNKILSPIYFTNKIGTIIEDLTGIDFIDWEVDSDVELLESSLSKLTTLVDSEVVTGLKSLIKFSKLDFTDEDIKNIKVLLKYSKSK